MSYIRKVIGSNERLVLLTGLHWIYIFEGLFWGCAITGIGLTLDYYLKFYAGYKAITHDVDLYYIQINAQFLQIPVIFGLTGFIIFLIMLTKYMSNEIGLTDRRIIHKHGLIKVEVQQVELEDIRGEFIHHGWLGWLLGYGQIHFDCRFIDDIVLPATRNPYRLVKAVHTARMRSEHIPTYSIPDLEADITRLDAERTQAFKAHENLKRMGRIAKLDFNKAKAKSKG